MSAPGFPFDACLRDGQNAKPALGSWRKLCHLCLFVYNRNITGGAATRFDPVFVGVPILPWLLPAQANGGCVLGVSIYGAHSMGLCRHKDTMFEGALMTSHLNSPSILFYINVTYYECTQMSWKLHMTQKKGKSFALRTIQYRFRHGGTYVYSRALFRG
jgi:hypothetical protein